jgi:LPXTG-motif cell wall-anchored protein
MKKINIRKKFLKMVTSAMLLGQMMSSIFTPIIAHADINHPQEVTIEYNPKDAYTVEGTFPDGSRFTSKTAPLFAVYDGQRVPVFCIEPGVPITNHSTPGYTANPLPSMSIDSQLISVLWKYAGTDMDTQIVTQLMMWKQENGLVLDTIIRPDGTGVDFDPVRNRINKVVSDYMKKPSFDGQTIKVKYGDSITLTDADNVGLSRFDTASPKSDPNLDWSIDGNKLTITPKNPVNSKGILRLYKSMDYGTPVAYKKAGQQTVMAGAIYDPNFTEINVEIESTGELEITKLDKMTGKPVPNTEFKVEYDGKSQNVKTNAQGKAKLTDILHGTKVKVTEVSVPAPYVLDKNNTKEVIVQAGELSTVEFKNQVATGKTTLTKQDETTQSIKPLNPTYPMTGAKYGFFKKDGTLLKEFTLGETLTATMDNLDLDSYYWQETVAPIGYVLDTKKYPVELTYQNQTTPVVVKDAKSTDDVIRMNLDGQKLIQNETNEMFKNGAEFTLENLRTEEKSTVTTATVNGKKGYLAFNDIAIDDYRLFESKGIEGYENIQPMLIKQSFDKATGKFTFKVVDEASGNLLNEEVLTQSELSKGVNVDLGTYTLKDKVKPAEKPKVGISTAAHIGDGETNTFTWGEDVQFYDDSVMTHENISEGTIRGREVVLVAVYNKEGKLSTKDVWTSGIEEYTVSDKEMTERVLAEYDYKQDPRGTRYYFKEFGYNKTPDGEYEKDVEHNPDGTDPKQDLTPIVEKPKVGISTAAHIGDGETNTFTWGEDVQFYDDSVMTHENIDEGTVRGKQVVLVAVYTDKKGKLSTKDVWTSGITEYKVTDEEMTERVLAEYDYKQDPRGTKYYFKEFGYNKTPSGDFVKDTEHNVDGTDPKQDILPIVENPNVGISTNAHIGDGKTNTFTWGEDVQFYDDSTVTHENIDEGTVRGREVVLVAVYTDSDKKETQKDVWTSGITDYTVTDKDFTERVLAEYDYKKDPKGTRYYFKEFGYAKTPEGEYEKDTEHNIDGKDKKQMITPTVKDEPKVTPQTPSQPTGFLPKTGEEARGYLVLVGAILVMVTFAGYIALRKRNVEK